MIPIKRRRDLATYRIPGTHWAWRGRRSHSGDRGRAVGVYHATPGAPGGQEMTPAAPGTEAEPTLGSEPKRRCNGAAGIDARRRNRNCRTSSTGVGWEDLLTRC